MKWIGQHIYDLVARFRNDVYLEDLSTTTETNVLVVDSTGKVSKTTVITGDVTGVTAGSNITVTNSTGPVPTVALSTNVDVAGTLDVTSLGTFDGSITVAGNVGIGTTSPAQKLDVVGKISLRDAGDSIFVGYQAGLNDDASANLNVGVGYQALRANTTGASNSAVGYQALYSNTTGSYNTAVGYKALNANTTGNYNNANGWAGLHFNTTGNGNVATGFSALYNNTTGVDNVATGVNALLSNTTGVYNTAAGTSALRFNTTGSSNVAVGKEALYYNTTGSNNVAVGRDALYYNTTGVNNTAHGHRTLNANTTVVATLGTITGGSGYTNGTYTSVLMTYVSGSTAVTYPTATIVVSLGVVTTVTITSFGVGFKDTTTVLSAAAASIGGTGSGFTVPVATISSGDNNTAVGYLALLTNTTGVNNTATGSSALRNNTTGSSNVATGTIALYYNTTGVSNTAYGAQSLYLNTTGSNNTSVGIYSSERNTTGIGNAALGYAALYENTTGSSNTAIGREAGRFIADGTTANTSTSNSVFLGHNTKALAISQTNQIVIGDTAVGLGSNTAILGNSSITKTQLQGNVGIGTATPTQKLDVVGNIAVSSDIDSSGTININRSSADTYSTGFNVRKRGTTGDATASVTSGTELGYHGFYGWDGTASSRGAYAVSNTTQNWTSSARGTSYGIAVTANGTTVNSLAFKIDQDKTATFYGGVVLPSATSIGNVSSTEVGYLDGVTSAIQTQFSGKANSSHTHAAENITTGVLGNNGKIGLANHPEGGGLFIPSYDNDLAFITDRGGAVSFYKTTDLTYTAQTLTNNGAVGFSTAIPFNGTTNYAGTTLTATTDIVVCDITMPFSLSYGNTWYVDFGTGGWSAKNLSFYAYQSANNLETDYKLVGTAIVNSTEHLKFTSGTYVHLKSPSGNGYEYNRLRVVMTNWATLTPRIAAIGARFFNSPGLSTTLLGLGGGTMYGSVKLNNLTASQMLELDASKNIISAAKFSTNSTDIKVNGTQALGSLSTLARTDHVHPVYAKKSSISRAINATEAWVKIWSNNAMDGNLIATDFKITGGYNNRFNLIEFRTVMTWYGFNHSIVTKSITNYNAGTVLQIRTNYISYTTVEVWVKLEAVNATQPGTITFEASDTLLVTTPIVEAEPQWDAKSVYIEPKFQITDVPIHITCPIIAPKIMAGNSTGLALYEDSGQGIFIKDGGNVGIGTATPAHKLDVVGDIAASAVIFKGSTSGTTRLAATAIAGTTTLTLPAITATLATVGGTETLTGKTLTSPVITTPTGIVKGDVGLGNVDNTSNATERAAAVTLTNKTLTTPIISSISNTGTLTLPTSTDTLVGRATTDTLTNKNLRSPVVDKSSNYTLEAGDAGKIINLTTNSFTVTVPISIFSQGDMIIITNSYVGGGQTITPAAGCTLYINGTEYTTTSFALDSRRMLKFYCTVGGASPIFFSQT